jgi:hypothetical protein
MMATAGRNMKGVLCVFILNRSHLTELLFTFIVCEIFMRCFFYKLLKLD